MMTLLSLRLIQAIGTSALYPAGIGMVRLYIKQNQNRVIGTLAVFATTSAAFGPTISGLLIQYGGWPVIFYVNLPVIFLSAFLTVLYIPKDEPTKGTVFKWDVIGMLLFSAFITSWMVFLLSLEGGFTIGFFVLALGLSFLFIHTKKEGRSVNQCCIFGKESDYFRCLCTVHSFNFDILFYLVVHTNLFTGSDRFRFGIYRFDDVGAIRMRNDHNANCNKVGRKSGIPSSIACRGCSRHCGSRIPVYDNEKFFIALDNHRFSVVWNQ